MKKYLYSLATDTKSCFTAGIIKSLLLISSFIYSLILRLIIFSYTKGIFKKHKINCKVISVGNITLGGTGKTPFVETLADYLKNNGHKVAILSRGYKRELRTANSEVQTPKTMGDEPYMLSKNLADVSVLVGRNRIKNAQKVIEEFGADTIILDDGFQYWGLFRDLDIVMIDAKNPFGNEKLMPRGILREPVSSLKRADIFVVTKTEHSDSTSTVQKLVRINSHTLVAEAVRKSVGLFRLDGREIPIRELKGRDICLIASIGNPESFYASIINLELRPVLRFFFLDHHNYSKQDIQRVMEACAKNNIKTIITTQKDAVRLEQYSSLLATGYSLLYLRIELKVTRNQDELYRRISNLYQR